MVETCRKKPNRSKVRVFTAADVRRIAKYAVEDGSSAVEVLAGVAAFLGFGWVFCVAARAIDNSFTVIRGVLKIGGLVAIGRIIDFLLTVVSGGLFKRLPVTNRVILVLVLAVASLESLLKAAQSLVQSAELIEKASETVHELCSRVKEVALEGEDYASDKYNDAKDFTEDLFKRITESEVDKAFRIRNLP